MDTPCLKSHTPVEKKITSSRGKIEGTSLEEKKKEKSG
jgi:hypothetical protein